MNHVYLSPHLDDAVLSCGGMIHQQASNGEAVQVLTIFAGEYRDGSLSPFAQVQHGYWGNPQNPMLLRRAEDAAALALLGADACHMDYLDAVYRTGPGGEWLYDNEEALWQKVRPADPLAGEGIGAVVDRLEILLPVSEQAQIYAPLAVGRHVDHQVVHAAAHGLLARGYRLAFYEDIPYAMTPGATDSAVAAAGAEDWQVDTVPLGPEDLAAKVAALSYYRSQIYVLFGGLEKMPNSVWAFASSYSPATCLAERLWWPPAA